MIDREIQNDWPWAPQMIDNPESKIFVQFKFLFQIRALWSLDWYQFVALAAEI